MVHLAMVQKELAKQEELELHFVEPLVVAELDAAGVADAVDAIDVVGVVDAADVVDVDCIGHLALRHKVDIDLALQIDLVEALVEMVAPVVLEDHTAVVRRDIEVLLLHLKLNYTSHYYSILSLYYTILNFRRYLPAALGCGG